MKLFVLALLAVGTCGHLPTPDAGKVDPAEQACAILASAGCAVGLSPTCAVAIRNDQEQGVGAQVQLTCILDAGANPAALRICHVRCDGAP